MNLSKDIIEQFSLPPYIKGKTFAEASEAIEKKFKDREDFASLDTKEELIKRLSEAQEFIKMQDALKNNAEEVPDMMDGGIPDGMEEFMQPEIMEGGNSEQQMMESPEMQQEMQQEMQMDPNMFEFGGYMDAFSGGMDSLNNIFGSSQIDGSGMTDVDPNAINTGSEVLGGVMKGANAGKAFGAPGMAIGSVIGGISSSIMAGKNKRKATDGMMKHQHTKGASLNNNIFEKGGKIYTRGGLIDPPVEHTGNVSTGPITWTKASDSTTPPFIKHNGNAINNPLEPISSPERTALLSSINEEARKNKELQQRGEYHGPFKHGHDPFKHYQTYGSPYDEQKDLDNNTNSNSIYSNKKTNYDPNFDLFNPFKELTGFNSTRPYTSGVNELNPTNEVEMQKLIGKGAEDYTRKSTTNKKGNLSEEESSSENKILDNIKKYGPDALRLSPVIGNILTRKNLKRAEDPTRDRLSSRFDRDLFDEKTMVNELDQNNVNRALTEASGGDMGGLRASILGANLNKDRARSSAMAEGQNINRNQNQVAQQFNLGVDSTNLQQSNLDIADSMANEGAYQTAKQNLNAAIATDLGRIGKELQDRGMAEKMFGYTSKGDYVVNSKGEKLTHEEHAKELGVDFKDGKYVINGKEFSPEELDKLKKSLFKNGNSK